MKDYKGGTFSLSTSVPYESLHIYPRMSTLDLCLKPKAAVFPAVFSKV